MKKYAEVNNYFWFINYMYIEYEAFKLLIRNQNYTKSSLFITISYVLISYDVKNQQNEYWL